MSTRATIKITDGRETMRLYHHCDGYPEGVGSELKDFLSKKDGEWIVTALANELATMDKQYEFTTCQHGDEEYAYLIDCKDKNLKCYKVGLDEFDWKEDKVVDIPD